MQATLFCRDSDDDVHVWTSIVSRWLDTVQGEPTTQLTYVVSLLRGAAFEWCTFMETRTGSRRLGNIVSRHAGALWIVNPCKKGTCSVAANGLGQEDCLGVF